MKYEAFSLTEMLIVMLILSVTAGVTTLNMNKFAGQTAHAEAERAAAFINSKLHRAVMKRVGFRITVNDDSIASYYGLDYSNMIPENPMSADKGCSFTLYAKSGTSYGIASNHRLYCNVSSSIFDTSQWSKISEDCSVRISTEEEGEYYIKVTDESGKSCNVIIAR